jgi:hypothetical protein
MTRLNGSIRVRLKRQPRERARELPLQPSRVFTVAKLARALGERGEDQSLEQALADHSDDAIRKALARTLAVPSEKIRRSRTALFLYLLKHNAHEEDEHDSRS